MEDCPEAPISRRSLGRILLRGTAAGLLLGLAGHAVYVLCGPNYHTVVPGLVYRSGQPSAARVADLVRRKGIRTIVNLRGCCDPLDWYGAETREANRLNISQEDISFSAGRLPSAPCLRQLIDVLDRSEYPLLFHCHKGSDRTGMASTIALLLKTSASLEEARKQLGWRYGHLPVGRTTNIDRFFDLYAEWLVAHGLTHSPECFHHWALAEYCPGECRCRFEVLDPPGDPVVLPWYRQSPVRVRCWNTSIKPWRLHPGTNAGIHLGFWIYNAAHQEKTSGKAGLFHAVVPPGGYIDLTIVVPLLEPGRYHLRIDLMDEQHAIFEQTGSEPLFCRLEVR
jgi:predicted protein tyrosine phosphatase